MSFRRKSGQNKFRLWLLLGGRNSLPKQTFWKSLLGLVNTLNYHWSVAIMYLVGVALLL